MNTPTTSPASLRLARLQKSLPSAEVDALLITDEINVRYISGFTGDSSYLLVRGGGATMLSDERYLTQLAQECPGIEHAVRPPSKAMIDLVAENVASLGRVRLGFEASHVNVALYRSLVEKCPLVTWVETSGLVETLRMVKDEGEIAKIRRAIDIAQRAYQSVLPRLRPQWTEIEVAHEMEATMRVLGAEGVSFAAIIGAGPSGALPHYRPQRTPLGNHSTLLMDFGAKFQGYASDITRTLGNTKDASRPLASDAFRRAHDAVLEAQLAAIAAIGPGVAAKHVDETAREVLRRHGLAEAFMHGLGHGIGLQIHESPRMSALSTETLAAGMVITVEPGVYFAGDFGIRIEDDILVTESGREVLTSLAKGLDDCALIL